MLNPDVDQQPDKERAKDAAAANGALDAKHGVKERAVRGCLELEDGVLRDQSAVGQAEDNVLRVVPRRMHGNRGAERIEVQAEERENDAYLK